MSISLRTRIIDFILFEILIKYRNIFLTFFDKCCINDFFRYINRKKMILLLYHGISENYFSIQHKRYLPKSIFEKQVIYLKKKKYKFITLSDWVNQVENKIKVKDRYIILTFDDGFKNVVEQAYPIMKKYDAKGCFYVISDIIENEKLIWGDYIDVFIRNYTGSKFNFIFKDQELVYSLNSESSIKRTIGDIKEKLKFLNNPERASHLKEFNKSNNIKNFAKVPKNYLIADWDDLKSLDKNILEIGGHSKTHTNLTTLNAENEFYEELFESKVKIEEKVNYPVIHLSYPIGFYNKIVIDYAKKYGYLTGTTIIDGLNSVKTDLFQLKRIRMDNELTLFKYKISGLYYFAGNKIGALFPNKFLFEKISKFFKIIQ